MELRSTRRLRRALAAWARLWPLVLVPMFAAAAQGIRGDTGGQLLPEIALRVLFTAATLGAAGMATAPRAIAVRSAASVTITAACWARAAEFASLGIGSVALWVWLSVGVLSLTLSVASALTLQLLALIEE